MNIPSRMGINHGYDSTGSNWETGDLQYLWDQGYRRVRLNVVQVDYTTYPSTTLTRWRTHVQNALNMGFYVIYGMTAGGQVNNYLTQANWNLFAAQVRQEAAWAQSQNNPNLEFQIGNEEEAHHYVPISTLTQSGGTATATTPQPHTYTNGESVTITGANNAGYNGTFTITVTSSTTFTFSVNASTPSPDGSANIESADLTPTSIRALIRANATQVKAIYTVGNISCSSSLNPTTSITDWASEGIGSLDKIGFNVYGTGSNPRTTFATYISQIQNGFTPGTAFISEWGTGNGYFDFNNEEAFLSEMGARKVMVQNSGLEAYLFSYMSSVWALKSSAGDYRYAWPLAIGMRRWFTGNPNSLLPSRGSVPNRGAVPNRSAVPNRGVI